MKNLKPYGIALALIVVAFLFRMIPHAANFTPVLAIAIFSGAVFSNRLAAVAIPVCALYLSNFFLGYGPSSFVSLAIIGGLVFLGMNARKARFTWLSRAFLGAVVFFVLSNFGVWAEGTMYPRTFEGLVDCYIMGIPFFRNTLGSTMLFSGMLFEGYRLGVSLLKKSKAPTAKNPA